MLRNLKIIGIFTRLSLRDQKNQYLKLIPYAWKLIENRTKDKPVFKDRETCVEEWGQVCAEKAPKALAMFDDQLSSHE